MPVKKMLDSNLVIYSLLDGHPLSRKCEEFIKRSMENITWVTTPVTFFESYFILKKAYGCDEEQVVEKIDALLKLPMEVRPITREDVLPALRTCSKFNLHINDGLLYNLALSAGISSLATDDENLMKVCSESGISVETAITPRDREELVEWERENLPEKGLPRILLGVYNWLNVQDAEMAHKFEEETNYFKKLP
ncbi:MAG: type II toxin-antitoxin system VapC family toxin [Candidatus Hydrothermarchaeales archaeon]